MSALCGVEWEDETDYRDVTSGDYFLADSDSSDEEYVPPICVQYVTFQLQQVTSSFENFLVLTKR